MTFLRLLILLICDFRSIENHQYQSNETTCNSFFHPKLEFFVLGFNVDHSKLMRLSFCHVLSWFANITNSKPNNLPLWQSMTKHTCNIMPIYNKMPKYITNPNLRLLTQKLQEDVEGLDQNVLVFPETLNKHITACVERKTY